MMYTTNNRWMIGDAANNSTAMIQSNSTWTRFEDKQFEQALVLYSENDVERWQKIANHVPGRTVEDVMMHYDTLVHDVFEIDSGRVEPPSYPDDDGGFGGDWDELDGGKLSQISFGGGASKKQEVERKKGTPWTEEEHRTRTRTKENDEGANISYAIFSIKDFKLNAIEKNRGFGSWRGLFLSQMETFSILMNKLSYSLLGWTNTGRVTGEAFQEM
ncbi:transcription factor DIVARICATA isoform X2 [Capsicum annuum]|uniref:transcription factor DIVARICATA isoform X2 n=1 Tax=Capsicum annuum TaxID=4072 RepID=UPI001FB086D9|nr:transcription factor DIVARICATA isoform X2 [Capsicum annuum]